MLAWVSRSVKASELALRSVKVWASASRSVMASELAWASTLLMALVSSPLQTNYRNRPL